MLILNIPYKSRSDFRFTIDKYPDGQHNFTIQKEDFTSLPNQELQILSRLNNWLDLEIIIAAAAAFKIQGYDQLHLKVPYMLGSRSDRQFTVGSPNYLRDVLSPVINSLRFKTVTCLDPHSDVLEACIKGFKKQSNHALVEYAFQHLYPNIYSVERPVVIISPDAGATKKLYKLFADTFDYENLITCSKDRDEKGALTKLVIPIKNSLQLTDKDLILIDDICDGGRTFINIAKELKKHPSCGKMYLIVTHGIFSAGLETLLEHFEAIFCTNSYQDIIPANPRVHQLNVF